MTSSHCTMFCPEQGRVEGPASPATVASVAGGDVRRRVLGAATLAAGLWAVYGAFAAYRGQVDLTVGIAIGASFLASLGLAGVAVRQDACEQSLAGAGGLYLLGTSFAISWVEQHLGLVAAQAGVSWNAVWVAFVPLLVPCSPTKTSIKAAMAATMTPVAIALYALVYGRALPSLMDFLVLATPVYLGALLAFAAARFLDRIGNQLARYRDVGRYELVRRLGQGGMGEVWEARHRQLARPAAVKLIRHADGEEAKNRVASGRFEREAQVTASLQSPHSVQLFDYGVTDQGELFYVMELLQGMDLEELVQQHGPLPPERVAHVMRQALDSLQEAHARGLVHRDIKPGNLFLSRYGLRYDHVKVLDFGLVKLNEDTLGGSRSDLSTDDRISGTPAYLAPEVVTAGEVDGRADVYALGCVAYFLLTGRRVVEADAPLAAAVAHITEDPTPPREHGVEVPEALEEILYACLEKDPIRRPDAWTLAEMLEAAELKAWTQREAKAWWNESGSLPPPPVDPLPAVRHDAWAGAAEGHA